MLSFSDNELREKTAALGVRIYLLDLFIIERVTQVLILAA